MSPSKIIAVDLDGTLTLTDTLHESVLVLVSRKPLMLFFLPFWLIRGLAYFKLKVAENCVLDVTTLPYNLSFISWLKEQKIHGKKIVLCTAANKRVAQAVSDYLGFFDDVIASNEYINLKGSKKRIALLEKYGERGYDYAGNSCVDIKVWASAAQAIVVNASDSVQKKASQVGSIYQIFSLPGVRVSEWIRAVRLHQWLKNLLLFVPLLAAHKFDNIQSLISLVIAFFSFSLCASAIYIINDLFDLKSDRSHPRKRYRPFASGRLSIASGLVIAILLIILSIGFGFLVGVDFLFVLSLYLLLTVLYSLVLKRLVLVDCLILAALYTVRIIAGAVAVSVSLSFWLLAFSTFIFLSLALVKRYAELVVQAQEGKNTSQGRGYLVSDTTLLQTLGVSSGYISVLVIALYVRSEEVVALYSQPIAIWLLLPILLFWISWIWLKAARGEMHDDPIVFAVQDKVSLLVVALKAIVFLYAATGIGFK
jgi:4-hydroxybenzoate polyprenyltransferase